MVVQIIPRALHRCQHRARYLQGHIAEEENADSQAEHAIIEPKVARRSNCGAGHTRAIDIIGDVKEENKRKQPKRNMVACAAGKADCSRRGRT